MRDAPPGRPTRNNSSSQIREHLQVYLLLALGIGLTSSSNGPFGGKVRQALGCGSRENH